MTVTLASLRRRTTKKMHQTVSLSRQRERCGHGASVAQTARVLVVHMCKCPAGWHDQGWVPSRQQQRHSWIFHHNSCSFYIHRPLNMRTVVGWYEEPCSLYFFLCFYSLGLGVDQICEAYHVRCRSSQVAILYTTLGFWWCLPRKTITLHKQSVTFCKLYVSNYPYFFTIKYHSTMPLEVWSSVLY